MQWSRRLAPQADSGEGAWVVLAQGVILVTTEDRLEAAEATGTRVWDLALPGPLHPVGTSAELLVLAEPTTVMAVDLADGETRWQVDTSSAVWGEVAHEDVVYTGPEAPATSPAVVARDPRTGTVRWTWPSTWDDVRVRHATEDLVLVQPSNSMDLVVLDARTGRERVSADVRDRWVLDVVDDVAVVVAPRASATDPSGPNPAGDPGATLEGIDLVDGSTRWTQDVRASEVGFEVAAGLVLAPSTHRLTAIDASTGTVVWEVDVPGTVAVAHPGPVTFWPPDPGRPATTVVTYDPASGTVRRHTLDTGAIMWEQSLGHPLFQVAAQEDVVLTFDPVGTLVLEASTGEVSVGIDTAGGGLVSRTPYVIHDHETGYVTLLDVHGAGHP